MISDSEHAIEARAADEALEEMEFYADAMTIPLFDESDEEMDEWEVDPWDERWENTDG
jgi:hypothetical protein